MNKLRENKILIYAFFQLLILSSARSLIPPLIPLISLELNVGLDFIGTIIALNIFVIFFVSIITGNIIEIIGLKKVIYIGIFINLAGSILIYFAHSFPLFFIAYFLMELGCGILVICNLSIAGNIYPSKKTSSLLMINLGNSAGQIISPLIVSLIFFINIGWRYYYLLHLVLLAGLMIILWKMDFPRYISVESNLAKLFSASKKIISNPAFILCGIIIFFYVSIMNTFYVWFTSYFKNINVDINISSLFLSIYGVAMFAGMLIKNKLIKHFRRKRILFFSFIASACLLAGVILIDNLLIKNILTFLFGINIAGNFSITFSISTELFPKYTNSASGLTVAFANLGVMIFQYISGYLSEYYSKSSVLYINMILLIILIILTAMLNYSRKFAAKQ